MNKHADEASKDALRQLCRFATTPPPPVRLARLNRSDIVWFAAHAHEYFVDQPAGLELMAEVIRQFIPGAYIEGLSHVRHEAIF